jgi:tetratricopeptide (TPR) repeat protein
MKIIISLIIFIVSLAISTFCLSSIFLTFFYSIPRLIKEKKHGHLVKKVPIFKIIWAPILFSFILGLGVFLSIQFLPNHLTEISISIGLASIVHLLRIGKKNPDMDEDFARYYHDYLKHENDLGKPKVIDKTIESVYLASEADLKPLIIRALEKYTTNDFRSAVAIYDKILDLNPLLVNDLVMRAQCLERLNYNLDAIDDYELAISIDESDGNWFGLLGLLYQKIGNLDSAEKYLKLSIEKGWKMFEPNLKMLSFLSSDDIKQALIEKCRKPENLTRRNKKDFEDNLSDIDRKVFNANLIKTIEGVNRGLALDPENNILKELYKNFYSKLN